MNQKEVSTKIEEDLNEEDSLSSLDEEDEENQEDLSLQTTSYILKYVRKENELNELIKVTNFKKSRHCLFMIDLFLIKNNDNETLLVIKCHEIAAIHFEDFYERIYTLEDISKENKYFRALDRIEDIKDIIDNVFLQKSRKSKKVFIELENNILKLHLKLSFFDTEKEIILNIPKKNLNDDEKILILPMFLKEIQQKMNFYEEENKKYKKKKKKEEKNNINIHYIEYNSKNEKDKDDENNKSDSVKIGTNDSSNNNSMESEEKRSKNKKTVSIKKKKKKKVEGENEKKKKEIKFINNFF